MRKRVLILCTANSARSQFGEGLFRSEGGFEVFSAGTNPTQVRPEAIAVMRNIEASSPSKERVDGRRSQTVNK